MGTDDLCGDISRDNIIDSIAMDILEKLPKPFEIWRVKEMLQMKLCPTGVVLLQELRRYNRLVERMEKTLKLLQKVCVFYYYCIFRICFYLLIFEPKKNHKNKM